MVQLDGVRKKFPEIKNKVLKWEKAKLGNGENVPGALWSFLQLPLGNQTGWQEQLPGINTLIMFNESLFCSLSVR